MKTSWRFGILAALVVALFGLYPQFALWNERGADWNGVYASNDLDEPAYAAYLQALIDGRPRKNDPYSGRDETFSNSQPESIFSIQFAAPYLVAIPARILGLNASQSFIVLSALASFLTALALFWLIALITSDERFAAVATLIVMFGGAIVSGNGAISEVLGRGAAYPFLPFLRRYIPAAAFPFFFAMFGFVWLALESRLKSTKYVSSFAAVFCFIFLAYSYFYLWTTAAAFLLALTLLWLILRPDDWQRNLRFLILIDFLALSALIPYAFLLSNRAKDADAVQLLVYTHAPDLLRFTEIFCFAALLFLFFAVWFGFTKIRQSATVFTIAFALVPLLVFNHQIITGRSLQPFHYEFYVVNYVAALIVVLTLYIFVKKIGSPKIYQAILLISGMSAVIWGYVEVKSTTRLLMFWNIERDEALPVTLKLRELAGKNPSEAKTQVTLNYDYVQADNQPAFAPQAVLWARHQHVFAGVPWEENKQRFYQMIYYAGRDADWLRQDFKNGDIEAYMALFGWDRFNPTLSVNYRPLTGGEIEDEVRKYREFTENYHYDLAANPVLSYVVAPSENDIDFSNLKKWYDIDEGEQFGKYMLYQVKLKKLGE